MGNQMKRRWLGLSGVLVTFGLIVAACGGGEATSVPRTQPTTGPSATPAPTATLEPAAAPPTVTPLPARPRATPTPSPVPPTATPSADEPRYGGVLTIGAWTTRAASGSWRVGINPPGSPTATNPSQPLYNNLIIFDPYQGNKVITGELLSSWEFSDDGATLTMKIVPGIKFHDGTPFTSGDVVYTLNLHAFPPEGMQTANSSWLAPKIKSLTAPDDQTVVLELPAVSASVLARLTDYTLVVMPQHIGIEAVEFDPIGTGPMKLDSFKREVSSEWVRNDDYFLKDPLGRQLPFLDGIKWFQFSDRALAQAAFRTGNIKYLDVHQAPVLMGSRDAISRSVPGVIFDDKVSGFFGPVFRNIEPWNNPAVLSAIDLWLDRKEIVDVGFGGLGSWYDAGVLPQEQGGKWGLPPEEIMSRPGWRYVDADGNPVDTLEKLDAKRDEMVKDPRDRLEARRLLAEAGFSPGDIKVKLQVVNYEGPRGGPVFLAQMGELFESNWTMDIPPTTAQFYGALFQRQFDVSYFAHGGYGLDEPSVTLRFWTSTDSFFFGGHPPQEEVERLVAEVDRELDVELRRELIWDLQRAVLDSHIRLITHNGIDSAAHWPDVRDAPDAATSFSNVWRLHRIWLE